MTKSSEERIGRRREREEDAESSSSFEDRDAKDAARREALGRHSFMNNMLRLLNQYNTTAHLLVGVVYIALGVVMFTIIEECLVLTSFYLMTQIITTIGYGDVVPTSNMGKWFTTFYALGTILYLGSLINLLIESIQQKMVAMGDVEKLAVMKNSQESTILQRIQVTFGEIEESVLASFGCWRGVFTAFITFMCMVGVGTVFYATYEHCTCSYGIDKIYGCVDTSFEVCAATGGTIKTWTDSFYMCVITLTTIGFGDYTPKSFLGRLLFIPWAFIGVVSMATFATSFASALQRSTSLPTLKPRDELAAELEQVMGSRAAILNRVEFNFFFLHKNERIPRAHFESARLAFQHLDKAGKGRISVEDAVSFVKEHLHMDEDM